MTKYFGKIGKEEVTVEIQKTDGGLQIISEKGNFELSIKKVAPFHYSVLHENKSFDLRFYDNQKTISLFSRGKEVNLVLEDVKSRARSLASGGIAGVHVGEAIIEAQMPGKIVSVKVKVGDEVKLGQGVVVVEAMKMENEMTSPKDGLVKLVAVKEGQSVESGAKLVIIE